MTLVDVITGRPHRIALSFAPVDLDETQLPTGISVTARDTSSEIAYASTRTVGFERLWCRMILEPS